MVFVTVPDKRVPDLSDGLFDGAPDQLFVVDAGNCYPRQQPGTPVYANDYNA